MKYHCGSHLLTGVLVLVAVLPIRAFSIQPRQDNSSASTGRERTSLNADWKFSRFTSNPDSLTYDVLKPWVLPSANNFISGTKHQRPSGTPPGSDVKYVQSSFNDSGWESLNLPHDWAIKGPFGAPGVDGGQGKLPINGVGWYRRKVTFSTDEVDGSRFLYLDVDGAMSYSAVWLNGQLVGGWPYGYNSFRLDLTQYAKTGENLLAIRVDNALDSSRWYPGAGIYRNVWLVKVAPVHIGQYGSYITTPLVSEDLATVNLTVEVENKRNGSQEVELTTSFYLLDFMSGKAQGGAVASCPRLPIKLSASSKQAVNCSASVTNPQLWGPPPGQTPNMYISVSTLSAANMTIDTYETKFGIRSVAYDANKGVMVNGQAVRIQGTCNHHDLGSLGAAYNVQASERQQRLLQEMGSNALRTSHNPPAPEFLDIADQLGFMVLDEIFDTWNSHKVDNDFNTIFDDWREPDLRSFIRRDRNHPSIIAWGVGNEIPEQSTSLGEETGRLLRDIAHSEDLRPVTVAMNSANATAGLPGVLDIIGLNYQGEGRGTSTAGTFSSFHSAYPDKMIWTTESSSAVSSRGTYIFPVTSGNSAVVDEDTSGGDSSSLQVSAYELYSTSWGSSPDKVFAAQDSHPYVAGEYVWTGWDYIGEPTPYDEQARSSYFGIIDMAGFKKDRFFLYQAHWRPDFAMAHILPHWTWPDRVGQVTPVHVFSSGDEAELFVNDVSAGRIKKGQYEYRFRWDNITYQPGEIRVVTYKDGEEWATDSKRTVGSATALNMTAEASGISDDGLAFITAAVVDKNGDAVPQASDSVTFTVTGPGRLVSTDNGDQADMVAFPSATRKAFGGLVLAIVRADAGATGAVIIEASADGLTSGQIELKVE